MPKAVIKSVTFSAVDFISTFDDFGSSQAGNVRSVIRTIVCDHEQAITRADLCQNVSQCRKDACSLVVSGNEYGQRGASGIGLALRISFGKKRRRDHFG